ncbi:MAG TPA: hypothetical protein VHK70_02095 [Burkholderiaceae bacterium]|nr:hypothetical protein [Burkholderiaceae bacterium]
MRKKKPEVQSLHRRKIDCSFWFDMQNNQGKLLKDLEIHRPSVALAGADLGSHHLVAVLPPLRAPGDVAMVGDHDVIYD